LDLNRVIQKDQISNGHVVSIINLFIWRDFNDVINSSVKKWGGLHIYRLFEDVFNTDSSINLPWQFDGLTKKRFHLIKLLFSYINIEEDCYALFWLMRNYAIYDYLSNSKELNILDYLIKYENLIYNNDTSFELALNNIAINYDTRIKKVPHTHSIRKNHSPNIVPEILTQCELLTSKLSNYGTTYQSTLHHRQF